MEEDAGRDTGIWTRYGLDPECVPSRGGGIIEEADEWLASGVKIVAGHLGYAAAVNLYVKADSVRNGLRIYYL
jgi:hypothetical protein